jgi:glucose dehydrogenase
LKEYIVLALILLSISVASAQDWPMVNYDNAMSRHSPQTLISKNNVNQLQVKWILNTNSSIENSPLIVGKTGYCQNNNYMQVIAFDMDTGLTKWKYSPNFTSLSVGGEDSLTECRVKMASYMRPLVQPGPL